MSHELLRLSTLSTFPRTIDISMIRLARAGFYYTSHSSETKCFSCGITYKDCITLKISSKADYKNKSQNI